MNHPPDLTAEVARLKERVKVLEQVAFAAPSEYIEGWSAVAAFLGIAERTCRDRLERGELPQPCNVTPCARTDGRAYSKPRWRRKDIVAYAEGK